MIIYVAFAVIIVFAGMAWLKAHHSNATAARIEDRLHGLENMLVAKFKTKTPSDPISVTDKPAA